MELIIVRHGRPLTERRTGGIADPSLDPHGLWQAERVCSWLAHEPVDAVIFSPKARAKETVQPLADRLGLPIAIIDDLDEIDRRSSVYVPTDLWSTDATDILDALREGRFEDVGYDRPEAFRERVHRAWAELLASDPGKRVVVACHGGTIQEILRSVVGEGGSSLSVTVDYASITRVAVAEHGPRMVSLNETGHFDADRIAIRGAMHLASTVEP